MLPALRKCTPKCIRTYPLSNARCSCSVSGVLPMTNISDRCYQQLWSTTMTPHSSRRTPLTLTFQRSLSTLQDQHQSQTSLDAISVGEMQQFMNAFPDIVNHLRDYIATYDRGSGAATKWFLEAMTYNLPKGKKNRGLLTVLAYKNLVKDVSNERLKQSQILGWCVEMWQQKYILKLQCFFLLCDDVMDSSTTRRGQLCWHKLEKVGLVALNDALMIENAIYHLLKQYFREMDCYLDLMEVFHEVTFITTCGQSLDLLSTRNCVTTFSMANYNSLVANKTSYYTFYLPVVLAMHLAGFSDAKRLERCRPLLLKMGELFQIQDDYLDCFGDHLVTGKIGTDIQENKCTWLAVKCMELASEEERQLMKTAYGKLDLKSVEEVKELYRRLDLPTVYAQYESDLYKTLNKQIDEMSADRGLPSATFRQILNKIYHRTS